MFELYPYQKRIVEKYEASPVIPLFLDPGTGKTCISLTIACRKFERGDIDALLVIAPNHVDRQWVVEQIPLWVYVPYTIYFNKKSTSPIPYSPSLLNITVVNVDVFSTKSAWLRYSTWVDSHKSMIILDEATRIKNMKALRTRRIVYDAFNKTIRRRNTVISSEPLTAARCVLTGTPVTNGAADVFSLFEFLKPGYFGINEFAFRNRYCMYSMMKINGRPLSVPISKDIWTRVHAIDSYEAAASIFGVSLDTYTEIKKSMSWEGPYKHVEELRGRMSRDATFLRIEDVRDMPPQVYNRKVLCMDKDQAKAYYSMMDSLIASYKDKEVSASNVLTSYLRLQQIASGFIVSEEVSDDELETTMEVTWFDRCPKMEMLLTDAEEVSGPTIIVCHFRAEAVRIYDALVDKGYSVCLRTGWKNVGSDEDWKAGAFQFMVANIRVISMGFNYQHSHNMIFYSNTFSLEDRIQVEARIYRTGQEKTCIYTDYVMEDTIDMKVYDVLKMKKGLSDYIRDNSIEKLF